MMVLLFLILLLPSMAQATTYYISPSGSDSNNGLTTSAPFLTFAFAINASRATCGDTLLLRNGDYGDGTSTGKLAITGLACTQGAPLIIKAENQRQAKITDNGSFRAVSLDGVSFVTLDGLYAKSTNAPGQTGGTPFFIIRSNNVELKNLVGNNPNKNANRHVFAIENSTAVLLEDSEGYDFHRHCVEAWISNQVTVRRVYCNPRSGRIAGGFGEGNGLGKADAVVTMYPCRECVQENTIGDGTTAPMYLNEMNATFNGSVPLIGSKVLGSICYKCNYGNGIFLNSRNAASLNNTPQNITIKDIALLDYDTTSGQGIRVSDGVNITIDHVTIQSNPAVGGTQHGIRTDDNAGVGSTAAQNSIAMSNIAMSGIEDDGIRISGFDTWSGSNIMANGTTTPFTPVSSDPGWTSVSTVDPGIGVCPWVPAGSAAAGAGTGGSNIGADVLYRYVDGVLTSTPLWDPSTGAFPHGAITADGVNNVSGNSLNDFHTRVNVNSGSCLFPAGYSGPGGGDPSTVVRGAQASSGTSTTASPLTWNMTVAASQDLLTVCVGMWHASANVGSVSGIDVSGQAMTLVKRQVTSPDAYRAVEMWQLISPTAGSRTITATLTGSLDGVVGRSTEFMGTSGLNTAVGASTNGAATTLSVTADTNTNERVEDCTVSSKSGTLTHGDDQTGDSHLDHSTQSLRLASSTQNGSDGGVMSNTTGSTVLQAKVAVSLIAGTPDPPSGATLTISSYRIYSGYGTESGATPVANIDTAASLSVYGMARIRAQITGSGATTSPTGLTLYCRRNADAFTQALNTFGANTFRLFGPVPESESNKVPATGTPTTDQLGSSPFVPAVVYQDANASVQIPALTVGDQTEVVSNVIFDTSAGTLECRYYTDGGVQIPADSGKVPTIHLRSPVFSSP